MARTGLTDDELGFVAELLGAAPVATDVVWDRPHVVRVSLDDGRSVITKRPRVDESGAVTELSLATFERERAVLALLADVPDSPAPHLFGAEGHLVVMEDLPPGVSLAELLLGGDEAAARAGMVAYAAALGSLHASTAGSEERFGVVSQPGWADVTDHGVDGFVAVSCRFESSAAPEAIAAEGHDLAAELRSPGWWRTLVHGDPCPDNTRIEGGPGGRFRIFDFEHTSFGSCLLDASYVVAPFPTCWCFGRVPDDVSAEAVAAYRSALGEVRPEALDDRAWDSALAVALGGWIVGRGDLLLRRFDEDRTWGTTTVRVRVRRWLDAFLAAAERSDRFPALRTAGAALAVALADAWPDTGLPDYPALPTGAAETVQAPDWWKPGL